MKKIIPFVLFMTMSLVPVVLFGLAPEYKRNGECYLLIGHDDVYYRGVYRLNNPAGEPDGNPVGVKLFDPRNSYGISVNLNRNVYTFSENTEPSYSYNPSWMLRRLMKVPGGVSLYGAHCDTRENYYVSTENITYHENGQPVYTTVGPMGNEQGTAADGSWNISWAWSGTVAVVEKQPTRWRVAKTRVLCDSNCIYTNGTSDGYWINFVNVDGSGYGYVPNGAWWQSRDRDPSNRPGNMFYWDRAYRKYTYYDLNLWNKPMGVWTAGRPVYSQSTGVADSVFEENVKRSRISACLNCVCVNGSNEQQFTPDPKYVSLALSPFGRMYLYSRTQSSTTDAVLRKNGVDISLGDGNIRGYPNNLTTRWIGISAKSAAEDFIYLLGTDIIRNWLAAYNIRPTNLNINAVTVSDQWWLDGGIVYAYDASEGKAYQFVRSDSGGADTCKSTPKVVPIGTGVDDLKADGFGNLYFSRTELIPSSGSALGWPQAYSYIYLYSYAGRTYGRVLYQQRVDKIVKEREFGGSSDLPIGSVNIGNNIWTRMFSVPDSDWPRLSVSNLQTWSGLPAWQWHGAIYQLTNVATPRQVQLGVINVATPPVVSKPNGRLGAVDILAFDNAGNRMANDYGATEANQGLYTWRVENSPYWEGRNNQAVPGKSKWEGDVNGNGYEGGFVSSLMNTSTSVNTSPQVLYTWRIYRIQDAFGIPLAAPELVKEYVDVTTPNVKYYFRSGMYQIECSTKFKYYDYDLLQFGSTVASLSECIRPALGYQQAVAAPVPPSASGIAGAKTPFPENTAVAIFKVNRLDPLPVGATVDIQRWQPPVGAAPGTWANPALIPPAGPKKYHVITEKENNTWRVDGSILGGVFNLPVIRDNNMVPGSLKWENNMPAQFEWAFSLRLPNGQDYPVFSRSMPTTNAANTSLQFKLDYPTEPVTGSLTCKIYRDWTYDQNTYNDDGDFVGTVQVQGHVEYNGEVAVLVLDKTPPEIVSINGWDVSANGGRDPLYLGETYGLVTDHLSHAGYTNPASFTIIVRDNNIYGNMAPDLPSARLYPAIPERKWARGILQAATLYFERGTTKTLFPAEQTVYFPVPANADFRYYTSPGATVTADIVGTNWVNSSLPYKLMRRPRAYVPGDQYSYLEYVFNISDWKHLQANTGDSSAMDYCMRFPVDFANNATNYRAAGAMGQEHPGFALFFRAQDSSGNIVPAKIHLGNVWVRDTLRPIPMVQVRDYVRSSDEKLPYDIDRYLIAHPNPLRPSTDKIYAYHLLPNTQTWAAQANGTISGGTVIPNIKGIPWNLATEMAEYHPPRIDEGMEVFFTVSATDNIGVSTTSIPAVRVTGPVGLYAEGSPPQINATSVNQALRLMLERSGVYNMTLTAYDNALDFAGNPNQLLREIRLSIVVAPTSMNIRVIEKKDSRF
ncbi:MAG TPA: hypothetical protein VIV61_06460 [Candidatus Ozemobacteraceae bacterium]